MRLLFICSGNTCRSPMAAALARVRGFSAASAGLAVQAGAPAAAHAVFLLPELAEHRAQAADDVAVGAADLVVALTPELAEEVSARFPAARARVIAWDVADPVGGSLAVYERTLQQIRNHVDRLANRGWQRMRVALGADHAGFPLKEQVKDWLRELGVEYEDMGTFNEERVDYPDYAVAVGRAVGSGRADAGVLVCGSGIGMSIAANKLAGVRAAVCRGIYDARVTRTDNDANVLCLGGRTTGPALAYEILRTFLDTPFGGGRHAGRVEKIRALDASRRQSDRG